MNFRIKLFNLIFFFGSIEIKSILSDFSGNIGDAENMLQRSFASAHENIIKASNNFLTYTL